MHPGLYSDASLESKVDYIMRLVIEIQEDVRYLKELAETKEADRDRAAHIVSAASPFIGEEWAGILAEEIREGVPK